MSHAKKEQANVSSELSDLSFENKSHCPPPPNTEWRESSEIELNGHTISTLHYTADAKDTNYILVRIGGISVSVEDLQTLQALGVIPLDSVGDGVYLCFFEAEDLDKPRQLPFVDFVDIYSPRIKLGSDELCRIVTRGLSADELARLQKSSMGPGSTAARFLPSACGTDRTDPGKFAVVINVHSYPGGMIGTVAKGLQARGLVAETDCYLDEENLDILAIIRPDWVRVIATIDGVNLMTIPRRISTHTSRGQKSWPHEREADET